MRRPQLHEEALQPRRPAARDKAAPSPKLKRIYRLLLKAFGPQGWWPVTPAGGDAPAYVPLFYGAPGERGAFEICAGAMLTQNTAWTNVEKALSALHAAGLMTPAAVAACPLPRLEAAIKSSGCYKQKARRLKDFCRRLLREHPEGLRAWFAAASPAALRAELLSYKGVGPETADSMSLYAAAKPSFVIDAYARRLGERAGIGRGLTYDGWKAVFEAALPPDVKVYNEYHALIVRLGKDFCGKTRPLCCACPLDKVCEKRIYGTRKDRRTAGRR